VQTMRLHHSIWHTVLVSAVDPVLGLAAVRGGGSYVSVGRCKCCCTSSRGIVCFIKDDPDVLPGDVLIHGMLARRLGVNLEGPSDIFLRILRNQSQKPPVQKGLAAGDEDEDARCVCSKIWDDEVRWRYGKRLLGPGMRKHPSVAWRIPKIKLELEQGKGAKETKGNGGEGAAAGVDEEEEDFWRRRENKGEKGMQKKVRTIEVEMKRKWTFFIPGWPKPEVPESVTLFGSRLGMNRARLLEMLGAGGGEAEDSRNEEIRILIRREGAKAREARRAQRSAARASEGASVSKGAPTSARAAPAFSSRVESVAPSKLWGQGGDDHALSLMSSSLSSASDDLRGGPPGGKGEIPASAQGGPMQDSDSRQQSSDAWYADIHRLLESARRDLRVDASDQESDGAREDKESSTTRGLLLYGGHDELARALAMSMAATLRVPCLHVQSGDIWKPYLGESEEAVRKIFAAARLLAPCVLFVEGVETMARSRDGDDQGGGIHARVLSAILGEMDGINRAGGGPVLVIGSAQRPWLLDSAMLRPGRFDQHFRLTPNSEQVAKEVSPFSLGLEMETMLDTGEWDFSGFLVPRARPLERTATDKLALLDLQDRGVRYLNPDRLETVRT